MFKKRTTGCSFNKSVKKSSDFFLQVSMPSCNLNIQQLDVINEHVARVLPVPDQFSALKTFSDSISSVNISKQSSFTFFSLPGLTFISHLFSHCYSALEFFWGFFILNYEK